MVLPFSKIFNNFLFIFQPARHTKLEKADILEMTVKYLQTIQRNQMNTNVQNDPAVLRKFKAGFADCTDEVNRYINQIDGVNSGVKQRLIGHLNNCVNGIQQITASPYPYSPALSTSSVPFRGNGSFDNSLTSKNSKPTTISQQQPTAISLTASQQDINNNGRSIQMGGVQFIPSRLPTGELALVMPNSGNIPYFPSSTLSLSRNYLDSNNENGHLSFPRSAFSSVSKSNGSTKHLSGGTSPPLSPISASSMSSCDDSMQTDLQSSMDTTPPFQTPPKLLSAFPTPPSGGSITLIPNSAITKTPPIQLPSFTTTLTTKQVQNSVITSPTTVQQPHVTSTTEQSNNNIIKVKPLSVITNTNDTFSVSSEIQYVNKKRPYPVGGSSLLKLASTDDSEPNEKTIKTENTTRNATDDEDDGNGDMWRPW